MGVPVVTLRGKRTPGRVGASLLTAVGLQDLIAQDTEDYLRIAASLSRDLDQLAAMRASLRGRMRVSRLCDGTGFANAVEGAYRVMWRGWCASPKRL